MSTSSLPARIEQLLPSGTLEELLRATIEHFDCQAGTLHLYRNGVLQLAAHAGIPPQVVQIVETVPIGKGIAGLAAERRVPITICNLQTDTSGQARPGAKATGMEGSLAVPMLAPGDHLRGVLGIAKAAAHDWTPEETAQLEAIARVIAERPILD
ncbi:GAF domain-containing protein [Verrucomicrobiota bacterium sgz303538]